MGTSDRQRRSRTDQTVDQLRADRRAHDRAVYLARKVASLCTRCGDPVSDGQFCRPCGKAIRKLRNQHAGVLRARRRRKGQCARCGRKSKRYECFGCLLKLGRLPRSVIPSTTDQTVDPVQGNDTRAEVDGYERQRYHGRARRGAPSRDQADSTDLLMARSSFARAEAALGFLRGSASEGMSTIDRSEARKAAMAHLDLCSRTLNEILARNRFPTQ